MWSIFRKSFPKTFETPFQKCLLEFSSKIPSIRGISSSIFGILDSETFGNSFPIMPTEARVYWNFNLKFHRVSEFSGKILKYTNHQPNIGIRLVVMALEAVVMVLVVGGLTSRTCLRLEDVFNVFKI